jgi:hypothetical protein
MQRGKMAQDPSQDMVSFLTALVDFNVFCPRSTALRSFNEKPEWDVSPMLDNVS